MAKKIFLTGLCIGLAGLFLYAPLNAHEDALKLMGMGVVAVKGELSGIDGKSDAIAIVEQGTNKILKFLIKKNTLVSICRMDVCNVGKGMNAFNASGRYEDIGIAQKGSMVMVLTRLDHTDVISVDIHLKNISDALSPSDFDTYLRYF